MNPGILPPVLVQLEQQVEAVGSFQVHTAPALVLAVILILDGQDIVSPAFTVTVKLQVAKEPQASCTV